VAMALGASVHPLTKMDAQTSVTTMTRPRAVTATFLSEVDEKTLYSIYSSFLKYSRGLEKRAGFRPRLYFKYNRGDCKEAGRGFQKSRTIDARLSQIPRVFVNIGRNKSDVCYSDFTAEGGGHVQHTERETDGTRRRRRGN